MTNPGSLPIYNDKCSCGKKTPLHVIQIFPTGLKLEIPMCIDCIMMVEKEVKTNDNFHERS